MKKSTVRSQGSGGVSEKSLIFQGGGGSEHPPLPTGNLSTSTYKSIGNSGGLERVQRNRRFLGAEDSGSVHKKSKTFWGWQAHVMIFFLLLTASCLLPATASAHRVNIYGYAEDGKVFVEGYFVDGTKAMNSLVEVFDAETGEKLLEGKTNKEGVFSFKIPKLTALKLVLTASMGHKNDYTISREEVAEALGQSGASQESAVSSEQSEVSEQSAGQKEEVAAQGVVVSSKEIEQVVAKVLDRKLLPIKNILLKMQQEASRPRMTEIIGGIGYILGIMGIVLYFKSKNR